MNSKRPTSLYDDLKLLPTCSKDEIHKAWNHFKINNPENSARYLQAFKAYQVLCDPERRVMYNSFGIEDGHASRFNDEMYFSNQLCKNPSVMQYEKIKWHKRPQNIYRDVNVTLEDLYNGKQVMVKEKRNKICPTCENAQNYLPCPHCITASNPLNQNQKCKMCNGRKFIARPTCTNCQGKRYIPEERIATASVLKGMKNGEIITLKGLGNYLHMASNMAADLLLTIKQKPHSEYQRQGDNLYVVKTVSLTEALCGYRGVFTHLDGRKLLVSSGNAVLTPGCRKVIKGEGMPIMKSHDQDKGDLIVIFQIKFPDSLKNLGGAALKEIENYLPPKPQLHLHNKDVLQLTDFDPKHKFQKRQKVYDDDKPNIKLPTTSKERCMQQ